MIKIIFTFHSNDSLQLDSFIHSLSPSTLLVSLSISLLHPLTLFEKFTVFSQLFNLHQHQTVNEKWQCHESRNNNWFLFPLSLSSLPPSLFLFFPFKNFWLTRRLILHQFQSVCPSFSSFFLFSFISPLTPNCSQTVIMVRFFCSWERERKKATETDSEMWYKVTKVPVVIVWFVSDFMKLNHFVGHFYYCLTLSFSFFFLFFSFFLRVSYTCNFASNSRIMIITAVNLQSS